MHIGKWIGGAVLAAIGLVGLAMSARASEPAFSLFGLLLFVFAILMIFRFITLGTEARETL